MFSYDFIFQTYKKVQFHIGFVKVQEILFKQLNKDGIKIRNMQPTFGVVCTPTLTGKISVERNQSIGELF